jgi:nucleolar complex protein 3
MRCTHHRPPQPCFDTRESWHLNVQNLSLMASRSSKRRKLDGSLPAPDGAGIIQQAYFKSAASWNLEQDYESRPRKGSSKHADGRRLPRKTFDGRIEPFQDPRDEVSDESDAELLNGSGVGLGADMEEPEDVLEGPVVPDSEQIRQAQEELARIASSLLESPEDNTAAFKALAVFSHSRIVTVRKLALLTQLTIYKDVIPGYRIRPVSQDQAGELLSKEVRRVQSYEQALVAGYQSYIKDLATVAQSRPQLGDTNHTQGSIVDVAISCTCNLLTAVPHFNFRRELIRVLVRKLSSRKVDSAFEQCVHAFETLFEEDDSGAASQEAVSLLVRMMKVREWQIDESVLNLFLHLSLLSQYSGRASRDGAEVRQESGGLKQRKEFRTKRERKALKEQKSLAKAMNEADALVSHEERERIQSEVLKMVFATYFRILKSRVPHLLGAVQEGLVKYAHRINQDFFGDLLEALKDLMRLRDGGVDGQGEQSTEDGKGEATRAENDAGIAVLAEHNLTRAALLNTVTAFALLAGQDAHNARAGLHLDLSYFVTHLFSGLLELSMCPDLERSARLARRSGAKADRSNTVNHHTTTVLLVRCLTFILLPPWNIRSVPPLRLAAFTKQLATAAIQMPEKSCQAVLALIHDVLHTHAAKVLGLWNTEERKADGTYNPQSASVEGSNPLASTIWEGELLRKHYCPQVRERVRLLEKKVSSAT